MERLTDSNKEIPTLDDNAEYWLKVYFKLKDYEDLEQRRKLIKILYNKLAESRGGIDDAHACNCQHNSNSRDNEPCCRCDSRQTNADRIRNMSDEELAEFMAYNAYCEECYVKKDDPCCYPDGTCKQKHLEWLQSEAE